MEHYDEKYFSWQKSMGMMGAKLNKFLFSDHINENDFVLDFGCGGGYLLKELNCANKMGVEINKAGRVNASSLHINTVENISEVENDWATVIISNHALEHVDRPLDIIKELIPKVKTGGKIIFVTPFERTNEYRPNDINYHLYTWSPMNLGNLFHRAGLEILEVKKVSHKWPPKFDKMVQAFGYNFTGVVSKIYGLLNRNQTQVRIVAVKK